MLVRVPARRDKIGKVIVHGEIEKILKEIAANRQDAKILLRDVSDGQFNWKPAPAVWSIAENFTHLSTVIGLDLQQFDRTIRDAKANKLYSTGPFRYGFFSRLFVRLMEPPPRRRFTAPAIYTPPPERPLKEALSEFQAALDRLEAYAKDANGLNLVRAKVVSPVTKYMRMPLGARFLLMTAHNRRHFWQAQQVKQHADFPRA